MFWEAFFFQTAVKKNFQLLESMNQSWIVFHIFLLFNSSDSVSLSISFYSYFGVLV
ncbi:hypothetical protein LEP1GSC199_3933 [Leptospira vanthielii serovar Holland str. Waz Holland = ATCC 700522]|uniref:Uncharacterized protein n=1 Tax=Leptospira vanthielii serovar Holland str. Waz Holland = ATCC 700522 TaxID=1218591 RepID=N1W3A0_9LEPT|nr:hypothetical protein LEP1GSC199_3933 [Leptospira vanthielii serovar Holland str. Waz Holland = ATCC 700522]